MNKLANDAGIRAGIVYQNLELDARNRLDAIRAERGEISSWLFLAAGLVLAAAFIIQQLGPWFQARVGDITGSAPAAP